MLFQAPPGLPGKIDSCIAELNAYRPQIEDLFQRESKDSREFTPLTNNILFTVHRVIAFWLGVDVENEPLQYKPEWRDRWQEGFSFPWGITYVSPVDKKPVTVEVPLEICDLIVFVGAIEENKTRHRFPVHWLDDMIRLLSNLKAAATHSGNSTATGKVEVEPLPVIHIRKRPPQVTYKASGKRPEILTPPVRVVKALAFAFEKQRSQGYVNRREMLTHAEISDKKSIAHVFSDLSLRSLFRKIDGKNLYALRVNSSESSVS